jgi:hypothetical protein
MKTPPGDPIPLSPPAMASACPPLLSSSSSPSLPTPGVPVPRDFVLCIKGTPAQKIYREFWDGFLSKAGEGRSPFPELDSISTHPLQKKNRVEVSP